MNALRAWAWAKLGSSAIAALSSPSDCITGLRGVGLLSGTSIASRGRARPGLSVPPSVKPRAALAPSSTLSAWATLSAMLVWISSTSPVGRSKRLRPALEAVAAVDQLRVDADRRGRAADAARQDMLDAELAGGRLGVAVAQHFRGGAGDDLQARRCATKRCAIPRPCRRRNRPARGSPLKLANGRTAMLLASAAPGLSRNQPPMPGRGERGPAADQQRPARDARPANGRRWRGWWLEPDHRARGIEHIADTAVVVAVALPADQRQRLGLAEAERRVDLVDPDRQIGAAAQRPRRFVADETAVRAGRALAPHDDDAGGLVEWRGDLVAPLVAAADMRIPPDRQALGLRARRPAARPAPGPRPCRRRIRRSSALPGGQSMALCTRCKAFARWLTQALTAFVRVGESLAC